MALVRGTTLAERIALEDWAFARGAAALPGDVDGWQPAGGPTTIAAALRAAGAWELGQPRAFDEETWWMRARVPPGAGGALLLEGLATICDVFVDGRHALRSESMFHAHEIDLGPDAREIALRFSPVAAALAVKRPRPRWKTRLASHQQLRWIRTSLVGRMPGWSPPVPPIGAWRPVVLERPTGPKLRVIGVDVDASVLPSGEGRVAVRVRLSPGPVHEASLSIGHHVAALELDDTMSLRGEVTIASVERWWPHTHGEPRRYPAKVTLSAGAERHEVDLGHVAFRTVRADTEGGAFALHVNDVPVFCRGASWTTTDVVTLSGGPEDYARVLSRVKDAGMNMLRLSGTTFYETDAFYEACDELGILVWQDFMFANMDYPIDDDAFRASVVREARELLSRLEARPCLAVLCGGSEVEQQAAMFGAARELWRGPLQGSVLPELCAELAPGVPYVPNSPSGGALPFHVSEGVGHYYGVGAYLRPFDDARRAGVRFASECLALANVPEDDLFPRILGEGEAPFVSARWKERTSKDHGSSWDFEDVRDHYTSLLFRVDPAELRYSDVERHLALSRVTSGEVMARVVAELRRPGGTCAGALVWFLMDLWPGAGWGVLDARGLPKSPYWYLRRAFQPRALFITDEGVNGLRLHLVNDRDRVASGELRFALYRDGETEVASGEAKVAVPARGGISIAADGLLASFADTARAYRFGPPAHDVAIATWRDDHGAAVAEATWLVDFAAPPPVAGLEAALRRDGDRDDLVLALKTRRFAHAVSIAVPGFVPEDDYFDLAPGAERAVRLRPVAPPRRRPSGAVSALNLRHPLALLAVEAAS